MNRLFGTGGKKNPPPSMSDTLNSMDKRIDSVDNKIRKLDSDLLRLKEQMSRTPEGAGKEGLKRQALQLLQQKKQYENQKMTMMGQSFNLEQTNFTIESLRATKDTVTVMQAGAQEMKKNMKSINIDKVEDLRDDIEDLMMESNEINEVLGRSYGTPEYLDEADLEAELGALQEFGGIEESPSYLNDLPSSLATTNAPSSMRSRDAAASPEPN